MSILTGVAVKGAYAFAKSNYEWIILGAILVVGGLLVASLWVGKAQWETKYNAEVAAHAQTQAAYEKERLNAINLTLDNERLEREKEHQLAVLVAEQRDRDAKRDAEWNDRVRNLNAGRRELLNHITRLTAYVRTSDASASSVAAVGDLPERLAACGSLLEERAANGRACAADYGTARNRIETCAGYAKAVSSP